MFRIFLIDSPYKRQARFLAMIWTLLIFIGCLTPGRELPKVDVPLIDKWVHLVMFGGFSFLWLCSRPLLIRRWLFSLFLLAVITGTLIELLQGAITSLGRSMELLDAVADSLGGLLGIIFFISIAHFVRLGNRHE